jgi:O-antigen/teichoic acid export membrane protein
MLGLKGVVSVLAFAQNVILTRLLLPKHFGQVGIVLLVLSVLNTFTKTGFDIALIQREEEEDLYLDVAWTVQALRGILLFILLIAISEPIAVLFHGDPMVGSLMRVLSLRMLIEGAHNIGIVLLRKDLLFPKLVVYMLCIRLVEFGAAVSTAVIVQNAWALVVGTLAGTTAGLLASYYLHPYRPHLNADKAKIKELFGFGRWVSCSHILLFIFMHGDDFLVAHLMGATKLGFYQTAYTISNQPTFLAAAPLAEIMFPVFSRLQDNMLALRRAYLETIRLLAFVSVPLTGAIIFFSTDFTRLFLGEKWLPMLPAMQLLAIWGGIRTFSKMAGTLFNATGHPDLMTKALLARTVLLAVFVFPLTQRWGILGTAMAVVLSVMFVDPFVHSILIRLTEIKKRPLLRAILVPMTNTVIMVTVLGLFRFLLLDEIDVMEFVSLAFAGTLIYLTLTYFSDRFLDYGMQRTILQRLHAL